MLTYFLIGAASGVFVYWSCGAQTRMVGRTLSAYEKSRRLAWATQAIFAWPLSVPVVLVFWITHYLEMRQRPASRASLINREG